MQRFKNYEPFTCEVETITGETLILKSKKLRPSDYDIMSGYDKDYNMPAGTKAINQLKIVFGDGNDYENIDFNVTQAIIKAYINYITVDVVKKN